MDHDYTGDRFYLFDKKPVRTVCDEGVIVETYSIDPSTGQEYRNDGLAYYIMKEAMISDIIKPEEYHKYVSVIQKELKIRESIETHRDTLDKLSDR
ncbi:MAG: hypothetical protein AAF986_02560 [Pseudomonadota bacterium]